MRSFTWGWKVLFLSIGLFHRFSIADEEDDAVIFMDDLEDRYSIECNTQMVAEWAYITDVENITAQEESSAASVNYFTFQSEAAQNVSQYNYTTYDDVPLYREFRFQADQGPGGLDESDLQRYQDLQTYMETIYNTATVCRYDPDNPNPDPETCEKLPLEPDLEEIMADTSAGWDELKYVWEQWRNVSGRLMRDNYTEFVALSNQAAVNDGYDDTGDYWLDGYTVTEKEVDFYGNGTSGSVSIIDQDKFRTLVEDIFLEVSENLYKPLHAYVRLKLLDKYPGHVIPTGPLPANILGNMWAQDWTNIAELVMPFPDQPDFDVTQSMIDNGWDIDKMFRSAEDFFTSIGLYEMTDTFWAKSVINQTAWGKTMECHASAEDFCLGTNSTDFRIKMCTQVNMNDLVTVHHEMGHIEYFMAYRDLPHVFRDSANPGFHEAIGDLIALSVSTPDHMQDILNLTSSRSEKTVNVLAINYTVEEQQNLNFLMRMALEKIAFLPFGYLIDKYRWGIFDGSISSDRLNEAWWELRENLQGVVPPSIVARGEEYFDAGAKFHVPANVPYIRYFVSFIVQFQFHKRLCNAAGYEGPLHQCDIYGNTDAGAILKDSMTKGFSLPWPLVLNELGGSYDMSAEAITEYFQPLMDYLAEALNGTYIGWTEKSNPDDEVARVQLQMMDKNMTYYVVDLVEKSWMYNINITDENAKNMNDATVAFSKVYQSYWVDLINNHSTEGLTEFYKRQFLMQQSIGTAILDPAKLSDLNQHLTNMMGNYSNKVCSFDDMKCDEDTDGLDIDALEIKMATVRDYSELLYYWEKWRSVSGENMIDDYKEYVKLMNEAADGNQFDDAGAMWIEPYTTYGSNEYQTQNFRDDIQELWDAVRPHYVNLHAYVVWKLKNVDEYKDYFEDDNLIPAHILGNMWAQSWENIYDLVVPYPSIPLPDITQSLQTHVKNVTEMFKMAEDFYVSLGMYPMTDDFWQNGMFEQPSGRTAVCHASAWDFFSTGPSNKDDGRFRIKMCANKNQEDFIVIHHEMGHNEYQMAYSNSPQYKMFNKNHPMPLIYRDGANPGFHEAIGDTIALSVSTPNHLSLIEDFLNNNSTSRIKARDETQDQQNLNFLMKQALAKVAFLPYAYILDLWRWEVFNGTTTSDVYNKRWWELRIDYQGLRPAIDRSPDQEFDIGCKYHVPANVPYIRYFVADILQFQFHEKLCNKASISGDIFNCDIYGSTEAGSWLTDMLKKGASEKWQSQLDEFLESTKRMSADSINKYFEPLWDYLNQTITEKGISTGWAKSADVIDDYVNDSGEISAVVPIIVGVVLAILVAIVLVAFFVGQRKRRKMESEKQHEKVHDLELEKGRDNEGLEMEEKKEDSYNY